MLPFLLITALKWRLGDDQYLAHVTRLLALDFLKGVKEIMLAVVFLSVGHEGEKVVVDLQLAGDARLHQQDV